MKSRIVKKESMEYHEKLFDMDVYNIVKHGDRYKVNCDIKVELDLDAVSVEDIQKLVRCLQVDVPVGLEDIMILSDYGIDMSTIEHEQFPNNINNINEEGDLT